MILEILGSGGSTITPKPLCGCKLCEKARITGIPDARFGPSVYIHDAGILFDTPEDIAFLLNRSHIMDLKACFYSHWHPDHTMGRRIFDVNIDHRNSQDRDGPAALRITDVYVPDFVRGGMEKYLSMWQHLSLFQKWGIIRLITLQERQSAVVGDYTVSPIQLAESYVSGYIVEKANQRVLILMDELFSWKPALQQYFDLVVLPLGFFSVHPMTGERLWDENHPYCGNEADFHETMDILGHLSYGKAIFIHVEEIDGRNHETLERWVAHCAKDRDWRVGFDTMKIVVGE